MKIAVLLTRFLRKYDQGYPAFQNLIDKLKSLHHVDLFISAWDLKNSSDSRENTSESGVKLDLNQLKELYKPKKIYLWDYEGFKSAFSPEKLDFRFNNESGTQSIIKNNVILPKSQGFTIEMGLVSFDFKEYDYILVLRSDLLPDFTYEQITEINFCKKDFISLLNYYNDKKEIYAFTDIAFLVKPSKLGLFPLCTKFDKLISQHPLNKFLYQTRQDLKCFSLEDLLYQNIITENLSFEEVKTSFIKI
jgi:hypothetical protein